MKRIEVRCPKTMRLYGTMPDRPFTRRMKFHVCPRLSLRVSEMTAALDASVQVVELERAHIAGTYGPTIDALYLVSGRSTYLRRLPKFRAA